MMFSLATQEAFIAQVGIVEDFRELLIDQMPDLVHSCYQSRSSSTEKALAAFVSDLVTVTFVASLSPRAVHSYGIPRRQSIEHLSQILRLAIESDHQTAQ